MKKYIQFFAILLALFASATVFAQTGGGSGKATFSDISFSPDNPGDWTVKRIPADATGQFVLATSKTDRTQFILELRRGVIARVGVKPAGGSFKALEPTAAPCSTISCTTFQIKHCFIINGTCVCVCGAWITSYPGN